MWDVTVATMNPFAAATATVQLVGTSVDPHMIATQQTNLFSIVVSLFRLSFRFYMLLFSRETLIAQWQHQRYTRPNQASHTHSNAKVREVDSYSIRGKQHDSMYRPVRCESRLFVCLLVTWTMLTDRTFLSTGPWMDRAR